MKKVKKSGPAIFMYCVIALGVIVAGCSFISYYGSFFENGFVLWIGIVAFMVTYHLWLRIIMGNVTKLFKIRCNSWWFRERFFEEKLYRVLRVKKWKDKALTYNPELFKVKERSLDEIAISMTKAELDHWVNVLISLTSILFSLLWGEVWIFIITAIFAIMFDSQFILIQRYNRPRVLRILDKQKVLSGARA